MPRQHSRYSARSEQTRYPRAAMKCAGVLLNSIRTVFLLAAAATLFTACGGDGGGGSSTPTAPPPPPPVSGPLSVDCTDCAALDPTTYSGSGTGAWSYVNSTTTDATINFTINGVSQGKTVTLLFSNGNNAISPTPPNPGILADPIDTAPVSALADLTTVPAQANIGYPEDTAHTKLLAMNRQLIQALLLSSGGLGSAPAVQANAAIVPSQPSPVPTLNTARTWNDLFDSTTSPTPYSTRVRAVCPLPILGRNVVIWVDPNAESAGKVTSDTVPAFVDSFCGASGGYNRLTTLLGDAWGTGAARFSDLIQDIPTRQDINIVIINAPTTSKWAGYFYGYNNFTAGSKVNSNQALVFFINADAVSASLNYTLSSLIHEATHMINFYQRSVAKNPAVVHDTWLEETTAMMSEDIIAPTVIKNTDGSGVNAIAEIRLPAYVLTGGNVSYVNWPALPLPNYALGGAFGAYLNRRYGLSIYTQLLSNCNDGTTGNTSYACLDSIIKAQGGRGFADEFAHFGASIFATLPPPTTPSLYGYPAKTDGIYTLTAIDVSIFSSLRPATATALSSGYTATTHTYQVNSIAVGKTSYVRSGVVVPAKTTLLVVIK